MKRYSLMFLAPLAALSGCVTFHTVNDGIARGHIGEAVKAGPLTVTPTKVLEDSRCPQGTQCVWAGRVRIAALLNGADPIELTLGQPTPAGGGTLTLSEVYPEPRKDVTRYPDEYRFGFTYRR